MRLPGKNAVLLSLSATFCVPADAAPREDSPPPGWRIHRSIPPHSAATHAVVPGARFRAGAFKRWLYGSDYRNLWTTPIEVAVLDLDGVGGGLTPLRTGGFGQSISLPFTGEDGRRYTVRSLDKDPTKRIWDELKGTIADDLLQDLIASLLPTGALVTDPLMEATGILHSKHRLVVIPDDPKLGEYREEFAGLIGTLQEHPSEGVDDTPGFAGSRKINGTEKLWKHLEKTPCNRVDARAYLKAKLMDFLIGDKDRHFGQWRWARFPDGDCFTWVVIPEDRDQAFIDLDGFAMAVARRGLPRQIEFKDTLPEPGGPVDYRLGDGPGVPRRARQGCVGLGGDGVPRRPARPGHRGCGPETPGALLRDDRGGPCQGAEIEAGRVARVCRAILRVDHP